MLEDTLSVLNVSLKQKGRVRKGTDAVYFCPQCKHRKRKLEINLLTGKYHCWVCGLSGLNLNTLFRKIGVSNPNINLKNKRTVTEFNENLFGDKSELSKEKLVLPKEYIPLLSSNLSIEYKNALDYLKKRGITDVDILRYKIGFCENGEFNKRIIIPSYDEYNVLNFFVARSYDDNKLRYKNSMCDKNIIGFESMIDFNQPITLVEGPFDAISVRYNCIPLFGKTMSKKLREKLLTENVPHVNILMDDDALKASFELFDFFIKHNIKVKHVKLTGHDPSQCGFKTVWDCINSTDYMDFDSFVKNKLNESY